MAFQKPIYKAGNLTELENKVSIPAELRNRDVKSWITSSIKLFHNGKEMINQGDEEMAYIQFMKYSRVFDLVRTEAGKKIYSKELGVMTLEVLDITGKLKESLIKRYQEREEDRNKRKSAAFSSPVPGVAKTVTNSFNKEHIIPDEHHSDSYEVISSSQLIDAIESQSAIDSILIIDVRSAEEFQECSLSANKFRVNCHLHVMNISRNIIQPGLSFTSLDKKLPQLGMSRQFLDQRSKMKMIAIIDVDTNQLGETNKPTCAILADILWNWDQTVSKIQTKPKILKGGFQDFLVRYPMYVTNSNVIHKPLNTVQTNLSAKFNGLYDFEEKIPTIPPDNVIAPPTPPLEDFTPKPTNGFIASNGFSTPNSTSSTSIKFPGIAKPVIPDRSSKPVFGVGTPEDMDMEEINTNKNQPTLVNGSHSPYFTKPNSEAPNTSMCNKFQIGDDDSDEEMFLGKFDDIQPTKVTPPTPSSKRKEFADIDMSEDEQETPATNIVTNNRSIPISMPQQRNHPRASSYFGTPSSLSRSLSSPNVAQFDEMHSFPSSHGSFKPFSGTPQIDRTLKPQYHLPKRYESVPKEREFSVQFTSKYGLPAGLRNLGNTCFMNAVLQCLNNTDELVSYLRSGDVYINKKSKFGTGGELAIELLELVKLMTFPSNYKCISPKNLKDAVNQHIPDFCDYKQQDAHEFLVRFLDRIHADMNENDKNTVIDPAANDPNFYDNLSNSTAAKRFWALHLLRNNSIITELFDGLILGVLKCLECEYSSKSLEAFTCLTLPVQEGSGRTSIQVSLRNFLKKERIDAEWHCPRCRTKRNAEKGTIIWRLPKYLVVHFKRFTYEGLWRRKIMTPVDFPIDNFEIELDGDVKSYNLYGVVNHSGSLEGGHYIAFSRNIGNSDWHRYDDQDVTPASTSDIVTANAYVLFYKLSDK